MIRPKPFGSPDVIIGPSEEEDWVLSVTEVEAV